jgi:hypothetical protein
LTFFDNFNSSCPHSYHNKLRCFYLLSQIVKNFSTKTDCGGGFVILDNFKV